MRTLLRVVAAVQTWTAVAVSVVAGISAVLILAAGETQVATLLLLPVLTAGGFASVGGILWCLTELTVPSAPPGRREAPIGLHGLARVLLGAGLLPAGAAAVVASDEYLVRSRRGSDMPLLLLFAALGLAGLGAVLGCLVRLTYPGPNVAAGPTTHPPDRLVGGFTIFLAFAVAASTTATAVGLGWAVVFGRTSGHRSVVVPVGLAATTVLGMVWCAGVIARPSVAPPDRSRGWWLRVLAGAQLALGVGLAAAAGEYLRAHPGPVAWPPNERVLVGAGVGLLALGSACAGGVLWCAVRVAYPGGPKA
ncbi:MAG TPA: hypothetical protein VD866_14975 [Urbifossiella sp.]|nr:hypothetical protein [Urbifossiella sp.]